MTEGNFTVKFIQKLKQKFNNLNIYKKLIKNLSETKIEASYKFWLVYDHFCCAYDSFSFSVLVIHFNNKRSSIISIVWLSNFSICSKAVSWEKNLTDIVS